MTNRTPPEQVSDHEAIRRQLEHEDDLTVNRLAWLVSSQSFLFTAYAIVLAGAPHQIGVLASRRADLLGIIPGLGLATCGLIYLGVLAGVRVTFVLRRQTRRDLEAGSKAARLPGTRLTHALGLAAPLLLPPLFFSAWGFLLDA